MWTDEDSIKAAAKAQKDMKQAGHNDDDESVEYPSRSGTSASSNQRIHQTNSSSAADTTSSAATDQAAAPVYMSSAPSKPESLAVPAESVLMRLQPVERAGMGLGEAESSMDTSLGSTSNSTTDEPDDSQEAHESKRSRQMEKEGRGWREKEEGETQ